MRAQAAHARWWWRGVITSLGHSLHTAARGSCHTRQTPVNAELHLGETPLLTWLQVLEDQAPVASLLTPSHSPWPCGPRVPEAHNSLPTQGLSTRFSLCLERSAPRIRGGGVLLVLQASAWPPPITRGHITVISPGVSSHTGSSWPSVPAALPPTALLLVGPCDSLGARA